MRFSSSYFKGLSELCLTPHAGDANATWQFLPSAAKMSPRARAVVERRGDSRGLLGYPFAMQSSMNLTRCARPIIPEAGGNVNISDPLPIEFLPCRIQLPGFFWTLSGW